MLLVLGSCGNGFKIPGVAGPNFSTTEDHVVTNMVLEKIQFSSTPMNVEIPKIPNSYVEIVGIANDGGTSIDFNIDIDAITNGNVGTLDPAGLPGGRELPVIGGKLPAVAFNIPVAQNVHIYVGNKVYGIFVPVVFPEEIQGVLIYTVKIKGKKYGNVAVVGNDSTGANSGVLVLADLNTLSDSQRKKLLSLVK